LVVTANAIRDWKEKRRREVPAGQNPAAEVAEPPSVDESPPPGNGYLAWRLYELFLKTHAANFEPATLRAFSLIVLEGKSAAEAAAELNITAGAARIAKCRVLKALRTFAHEFHLDDLGDSA
jgi:DNA-directed RNA polymerase specialized sigma24 family protein